MSKLKAKNILFEKYVDDTGFYNFAFKITLLDETKLDHKLLVESLKRTQEKFLEFCAKYRFCFFYNGEMNVTFRFRLELDEIMSDNFKEFLRNLVVFLNEVTKKYFLLKKILDERWEDFKDIVSKEIEEDET